MQIVVAPQAGFCFGVRKAIDTGENLLMEGRSPLASWGPLIHNPQEVARLAGKGIVPKESLEDITEKDLIIRTHGVEPDIYQKAQEKGLNIVDCTCPFVSKVQKLATEYSGKGYTIVILGDSKHPEVIGILGWANGKGLTVRSLGDVQELNLDDKICLVAQTTEKLSRFNEITQYLEGKVQDLLVFNTICSATRLRQKAALELASTVDLMLVVGGLNSANTQKLAQLCSETGTFTKHIEKADEIQVQWFSGIKRVGITAGASTPDWIIEEVVRVMEEIKNQQAEVQEEGMQEHFNQGMANFEEVKPGDILTGTVVQINSDEVLVDVGGKSDGIIPINELAYRRVANPNDFVKVGEQIKVLVLKAENNEGNMVLSKRRAEQEEGLARLEEAFNKGTIIEAEAVEVVKGGILVDVGMRGFVPASLVDRGFVEDLNKYIGQKLRLKVIEFNAEDKKAVLSQKVVLDEEYEQKKEEIWGQISEGQTKKGTVQRITDFGAFIDLGGIDGLLHVSEMGWGRVNHPRDIVKEGDQLDVFVLGVDKEKGRISLGLKQLSPSPWQTFIDKYSVGSHVPGKVVRIAPFGVFVELVPGVDGLVHISQLAWERVEKPEDVVSVGEEVEAVILDIDKDNKKVSLSLKEAKDKPVVKKEKKREEPKEPVEHIEESGVTIGDLFGNLLDDLKKDGQGK